jgi:hypothetical protein
LFLFVFIIAIHLFHLEVVVLRIFSILLLLLLLLLLFLVFIVFEALELLLVLNLIRDIVFPLAIAHAHAVLLKITRRLYIRVVFFLLPTEALINEVHKDPLSQISKFTH